MKLILYSCSLFLIICILIVASPKRIPGRYGVILLVYLLYSIRVSNWRFVGMPSFLLLFCWQPNPHLWRRFLQDSLILLIKKWFVCMPMKILPMLPLLSSGRGILFVLSYRYKWLLTVNCLKAWRSLETSEA